MSHDYSTRAAQKKRNRDAQQDNQPQPASPPRVAAAPEIQAPIASPANLGGFFTPAQVVVDNDPLSAAFARNARRESLTTQTPKKQRDLGAALAREANDQEYFDATPVTPIHNARAQAPAFSPLMPPLTPITETIFRVDFAAEPMTPVARGARRISAFSPVTPALPVLANSPFWSPEQPAEDILLANIKRVSDSLNRISAQDYMDPNKIIEIVSRAKNAVAQAIPENEEGLKKLYEEFIEKTDQFIAMILSRVESKEAVTEQDMASYLNNISNRSTVSVGCK
jgi:hypothetical protein